MSRTFRTTSAADTCALGRSLAETLPVPVVVLLHGPLGAGKTTLVQGMAEAYGIVEPVRSPTFALAHEYRGGSALLFHLDLYRLAGPDEVWEAGLAEYLDTDGLTVIEWAERLGDLVPAVRLEIELAIAGEDERELTVRACGAELEGSVEELGDIAC